MGENAAFFKLFDGFSRGNARGEFRLRFSNLLSGRARRAAGVRLWHFRKLAQEMRQLLKGPVQVTDSVRVWHLASTHFLSSRMERERRSSIGFRTCVQTSPLSSPRRRGSITTTAQEKALSIEPLSVPSAVMDPGLCCAAPG